MSLSAQPMRAESTPDPAPDPAPAWLTLPNGRRLAFVEYGQPDGLPAIYCHGFPSSRREAALLHASARATGVRIIAPDRPGYGDSDHDPDRRILDWSEDIARLSVHLGLERIALIGVSGGAPFALAGAWRLPSILPGALLGVVLVCPLGPIYLDAVLRQMHWAARTNLALGKRAPRLAWRLYGGPTPAVLARWPGLVERMRTIGAPDKDRRALAAGNHRQLLNRTIADAMRDGALGARIDLLRYTRDWGIPFADIDTPVDIWHGAADGTVPVGHAHWYAEHLPTARLSVLPGEGHYSTPIDHGGTILRALRDMSDEAARKAV